MIEDRTLPKSNSLKASTGADLGSTPYNEMYSSADVGRAHYLRYTQWLSDQPPERLAQKRAEAEARQRDYAKKRPLALVRSSRLLC